MAQTLREIDATREADFPELKGFDYIEFYVGNAPQAVHFYRTAFGFTPVAVAAGLEVGVRDRVSVVVEQGSIRFMLTSALDPESPIAEHVRVHGDSVKDIALEVADTRRAFAQAVERGARPVMEPTVFEDGDGSVVKATIAACGDSVHSFIQRDGYRGRFLPGCTGLGAAPAPPTGLDSIDHVAISVEPDRLEDFVAFYRRVMSFHQSHHEDIMTEHSGMNSKVMQNDGGQIKFPMMEPAKGKRRSQIDEYLHFHRGPGVQHIALSTADIFETARALRANGIEFLNVPAAYYEHLCERVGEVDGPLDGLRELNILLDRDDTGQLLQLFTKPVQSRPTFFLEIIQRKGARGFGGGNIKALFEAVELEQALRGNL